jgi:hypothetical protein
MATPSDEMLAWLPTPNFRHPNSTSNVEEAKTMT